MRALPQDDEWFEISDTDWLGGRRPRKKLKLLADAQFPDPVVSEIRAAGITIEKVTQARRSQPDSAVLQLAHAKGRVLLTLDGDFWDDGKHPLQSVRTGVIFVAEPPAQHDKVLRAFGLVYGCFAKSFPLDWWHGMKVRACLNEFQIKMRTWKGNVEGYRMKLRRGYVVAKEC